MAGRRAMKRRDTMAERAEEYLRHRRALGYALRSEGGLLMDFARFADRIGHRGAPTSDLALRWARVPAKAKRIYRAKRLETVVGFARYCHIFDPETEIPPKDVFGPAHRRNPPYIYTAEQLAQLAAPEPAQASREAFRTKTYSTVFGLLSCSGLRVSEALSLRLRDVDLNEGILIVRESKCRRLRLVPLHQSAIAPLRDYARERDRLFPCADRFFVNRAGDALPYSTIRTAFRKLTIRLGWIRQGPRPRMHDLRHTFASRVLVGWQGEPDGGEARMDWLSRYLGHERVSHTYWYLSAVPELFASAASRFEPPSNNPAK